MKRFIEGENRFQTTLFPESLDHYIADDNAIRVVVAKLMRILDGDTPKSALIKPELISRET